MYHKHSKYQIIALINLMYLLTGLLLSIISALIPDIIHSYRLSYTIAATLPFAYFIAFVVFSIPAGIANEKYSPKSVLIFSLVMALIGSLLFAIFPNYYMSIVSLFIIGTAIAINQVTIVPLLRLACGAENLAFHNSLNMVLYGAGAFLSPRIYSFLTSHLLDKTSDRNLFFDILSRLVPNHYEWISAYWLFVIFILFSLAVTWLTQFPAAQERNPEERIDKNTFIDMVKNKYIILYFIAITAYASCEQGNAVWMSKFFQDQHALDPLTSGASILSWYWILVSIGCIPGMALLKIFDSRKVLAGFSICAMICFSLGIYGPVGISKITYPMVGIFESVMWPVIFSLALNSVKRHHGALTGLLYIGSIGGAIGPLIIGTAGDYVGLRLSLNFIYLPLLMILSVSFWAKPLINNKTI